MQERFTVSQAFSAGNALSRSRAVLRMLVGCWHRNLSRPFTREGETYRACLNCGARRRFDLIDWRMGGPFFFDTPSAVGPMEHGSNSNNILSRSSVRNGHSLRLIA